MLYVVKNSAISSIKISKDLSRIKLRFSSPIYIPEDNKFPMILDPKIPEVCQVMFVCCGNKNEFFEIYKMCSLTEMPLQKKNKLNDTLTKNGLALTDEKHTIELVLSHIKKLGYICNELYKQIKKDVQKEIEPSKKMKERPSSINKEITYHFHHLRNNKKQTKENETLVNNRKTKKDKSRITPNW